jgi:rhamnogalacturonan endolyase
VALSWVIYAGASPAAFANNPGGGTGTGANVTLSNPGGNITTGTVTLANGIMSATINVSNATISSLTYNGFQTVASSGDQIYFSMDGGNTFQEPSGCVLSVIANTTDMVDVSLKSTYNPNNTAANNHPEDIDIHYVLRRGNTGLYAYAILNHPASYPALSMGEWRMVWFHSHTSTLFNFEKEYVDNFRHHDMPTYAEFSNPVLLIPASGNTAAQSTRIAEIALMPPAGTLPANQTSTRAGLYNCKYEFSMEYNTFGAWGHASDVNQKGVWFIPGSFEFFNDGPTKQDLSIAESYSLMHFGRDHYGGSSTAVAAGTAWTKIYGPYLLYCNSGSADACWADAQAQAQAEQAAWPYSWLTSIPDIYPLAASRGSVTGKFIVADPLKPAVSGTNAWVGLATPDTSSTYTSLYGNYDWQYDSNNYEYWAKADANGNFTIPNVRPGAYTLYAFTYGAVGQYAQANVTVSAGQATALGSVNWNIVHPGNWIAWEIGVPDRNAAEFRHGTTDYYIPYAWCDFSNEFTNPLVYNVGSSNWATDINYAHGVWQLGGNATTSGNMSFWPWNINFNLASAPASGNATLTIALAGSNGGHLRVWVNRATTSNPNLDDVNIPAGGGDSLLREGVHAKYGVITFSFNATNLHQGSNTITLEQINGTPAEANHLMYDYINLEMPGSAPAGQPALGRNFTWVGGKGNNSWDVGTFINWSGTGGNATFNQGDVVTFDDTGDASIPIALNGLLTPNSVTINSTQDYIFSGNGSITGATAVVKAGTGTLTLATANNYTGATTISGGALLLSGSVHNSANVTVQSGATLSLSGNFATGTVTVNSGGVLNGGAGASLASALVNNGNISIASGGTFSLQGNVTNNGIMRISGGSRLAVNGIFTNNGVLDLITGAQILPANLVNNGVVLDASAVKVTGINVVGGAMEIVVPSYAGHNYQLQWSASLAPANWQDIGSPQVGDGGDLTFTDSAAITNGIGFYRVWVSP